MSEQKIVVFLDSVNRTIAGVVEGETDTTISIKNPVIINAMPRQQGQMGLQLIPVFFREVLKNKNQDCVFTYQKDKIVTTNISDMEDQIEVEYKALFKEIPEVVAPPVEEGEANVVDLFGEKNNG